MADLTGKQLNDYRVLRRLGRGAMAEVYLAEQLSLGRQVALKVLSEQLARDPAYVARFQHEARAAASLVHSGIVQIYEVGCADGCHYIAQEYVAGNNLGELIERQGRLSPGLVLGVLRQTAAALSRASEQGIVHRDIKPENLMLSRSGEIKVADFGLARVEEAEGAKLTQVGVTVGTPLYMSPEQVEGRRLDSRSDIYSLGVAAYHLVCGQPPFVGDSPLAVALKHLKDPPPPLLDRCPDCPPALVRIIDRMVAKRADDRFASPNELLAELRTLTRSAVEAGWAEPGDDASAWEALASTSGGPAATLRLSRALDDTLQLNAQQPQRSRRWLALAACLVAGLVLGGVTRPKSLLAGAAREAELRPDVRSQLFHAKLVDTESAWQAVIQRFPDSDPFYRYLAMQGLVRLYLNLGHDAKAYTQAKRLADLGEDEQSLRTFGRASLVVIAARAGDPQGVREAWAAFPQDQLDDLRTTDRLMHQRLEEALKLFKL